MKKRIYIVAGPTASGKSSLAVRLAQKLNSVVVNADSLQVYEDVPILTARPTESEMEGVPHLLYGYLDCHAHETAASWVDRAKKAVEAVDNPVFVGGTGLYLKILMEGFSPLPEISDEVRQSVRQMSRDELEKYVPDAPLTDPQRLMRAAEVLMQSGKPLSYFYDLPKEGGLPADYRVILLNPPRERLYLQCNYRFEQMMGQGALKQVLDLAQKNPKMDGGVFQALGVQELIGFLKQEMSLEEAVKKAQQRTRNYAKRQRTWFAHQIKPDIVLTDPATADVDTLLSF